MFKHWRSFQRQLDRAPRILILILVAMMVMLIVEIGDQLISGGRLTGQFFWPRAKAAPAWKDLFQALLVLMGLPVGLMLWYWRDLSVRHQIDNARKDTTLKEFAELQLRAVGAIDESFPSSARIALQVAALHLLRPYLHGEGGRSFQLAAFEIYCSVLEGRLEGSAEEEFEFAEAAEQGEYQLGPVTDSRIFRAIRDIVAQEWDAFFHSGFPMARRAFRALRLPEGVTLKGVSFTDNDFSSTHLIGVNILDCTFSDCNMRNFRLANASVSGVAFSDCALRQASFSSVRFFHSSFVGSMLDHARWYGCEFRRSKFHSCSLLSAAFKRGRWLESVLSSCELAGAHLNHVSFDACALIGNEGDDIALRDVHIDAATAIFDDTLGSGDVMEQAKQLWLVASEDRRVEMRRPWMANGAMFEKTANNRAEL